MPALFIMLCINGCGNTKKDTGCGVFRLRLAVAVKAVDPAFCSDDQGVTQGMQAEAVAAAQEQDPVL